jgi:DUF1680 family protein
MAVKFTPLSLRSVSISDNFWEPKIRTNRERTLSIEYQQCRDTGRIDAFKLDWEPGKLPIPHIFWDSDVAKWIEAASYSLATHPDSALEGLLDEIIAMISFSQQPDGYLNSHFTAVEAEKRWTNLRDWHELYCAGHLIEAAVAHYQATGKRTLLNTLCRYADYIATVFGRKEGQLRGYPGHEELELALIKLYRATAEEKYLELAAYFIEERGQRPDGTHYYDWEAIRRGEDPSRFWAKSYAYMQAHLPVREQDEVVGHAVRAMYLYSAIADLAGEMEDATLLRTCERLWNDLNLHKLYITGGIGPSRHNEGFTIDYDLPNESAYAETCAAIGLVFWAQRLLNLTGSGRYADVMERALYNGVVSGVSLDGELFFYENPLASTGSHHRQPWFDCACCPPNVARLLASLPLYAYAQNPTEIAIHLFIQGKAQFHILNHLLTLHVSTRYPWEGLVDLRLELPVPCKFTLSLRKPAWCRNYQLWINGQSVDSSTCLKDGYLRLEREWQPGDAITYSMDMPVERMYASPDIRQDAGLAALQRGPLLYCIESADNNLPLSRIRLPRDMEIVTSYEPSLLGGVVIFHGDALAASMKGWVDNLYRNEPPVFDPFRMTAIPYYAWDNRTPGAMLVWLPEINQ